MSHGILRIWCSFTLQGLLPFALTVNEHHCYSDETVLHVTLWGMLDAPSSARCSLERESNFSWYLALSRLDFSLLIALARQQTLDLCFFLGLCLHQSLSAYSVPSTNLFNAFSSRKQASSSHFTWLHLPQNFAYGCSLWHLMRASISCNNEDHSSSQRTEGSCVRARGSRLTSLQCGCLLT